MKLRPLLTLLAAAALSAALSLPAAAEGITALSAEDSYHSFALATAQLIQDQPAPIAALAEGDETSVKEYQASCRLLLKSRPDASPIDLAALGANTALAGPGGLWIACFDTPEAAVAAAERLSAEGSVEFVEQDCYFRLLPEEEGEETPPADEGLAALSTESETYRTWGYEAMGMDDFLPAYKETAAAKEKVVVAIVDSGIDPNHGCFATGPYKDRYDTANSRDYYADDPEIDSHGTHVAGIVAGMTEGLDNITLRSYRVGDSNGGLVVAFTTSAILEAAEAGADVINLSLGGPDYPGTSNSISNAVSAAIEQGVIVCVCASNEASSTTPVPGKFFMNSIPAHLPEAVVVSAIKPSRQLADFSNFGPTIDFAAPGWAAVSCNII